MGILKDKVQAMEQQQFWDSLQFDIAVSGQNPTHDDFKTMFERSFIFSLFLKGCTPTEMSYYQKLFHIKNYGYVIVVDLAPHGSLNLISAIGDELEFHKSFKSFMKDTNNMIGPIAANRIALLISRDDMPSDNLHKEESITLCKKIIKFLETNYKVTAKVYIGTVQSAISFYTSYIRALSCLSVSKNNKIVHYLNKKQDAVNNNSIDYLNTEQHLFEAVRMHRQEAYNYFGILMDWLEPYDDEFKRNKIFELLTLITFAQHFDGRTEISFIDYTIYIKQFNTYKGEELIQNAFQRFVFITNYFQGQNTIDYSNHIVKATKEYLENHYSEDISLDDIAAQVNISPQYFSKLIKKTTGFNFIDWLSMLRVKKAKELLTNSNLTVKEVCFMVGYKDPNYFSRIFKKRNGMTPSEYVKTFTI